MKLTIQGIFSEIIARYAPGVSFDVLIPPDQRMGDYSTNTAFKLPGSPMGNARHLKMKLDQDQDLKKVCAEVEVIAPGFINFKLNSEILLSMLGSIILEESKYGDLNLGKQKVNLEFVSANPTGPPTVGNARAAAYGDTLGNILKKAGYDVTKEYYLNDVGVQVNKLGLSVAKRYLEAQGKEIEFEEGLYKGEYIKDIATKLESEIKSAGVENDIEALSNFCRDRAVSMMVNEAKRITSQMGVEFNSWFKESELYKSGEVDDALERLNKSKAIDKKEGATWLKYGDEQEAVLIKTDGHKTYLMGDIAYSLNKLEKRKFDKAINIWGTDHHGDVPRLLGAMRILGYDKELELILHQLVTLKSKDPSTSSGQVLKISKRAGNLVLLEELISDVGKDATRFFFLSKDLNTHMEFDVELAKEQSKKNLVFYIQYAFARLSSIFSKLPKVNDKIQIKNPSLLKKQEELLLLRTMSKFPDVIENIVKSYQVHHLANYSLELARQFHKFYEKYHVIQEDKDLQNARVALATGVHVVLKNCLDLMGLDTPSKM